MSEKSNFISVVTPTFRRSAEIVELLENLSRQTLIPDEIIIVDGAPDDENETANAISGLMEKFPFKIWYIRRRGGTALQRNIGIDAAKGDFIALIDDDVRLEKDFLENIIAIFETDAEKKVGGIVGYRTNQHFKAEESQRWRWYKRLNLLTIYEPGRYDFKCGYPINNNIQPPFSGTRAVDFMTTACTVWRREVFDSGLRFHPFFSDYGVLEDAHFSLRAGQRWELLQSGDARCKELSSPNGRVDRRKIGYKCVVNYYFVFQDIVNPLPLAHKFRFWRYQAFEFFRIASSAVRRRNIKDISDLRGRIEGVLAVMRGTANLKNN
jgi:glycosyltransferase involved in cell wall biosynthesis